MNGNSKERRRVPRHRCQGPIDFRIQGWTLRKGRILNVCLHGCLIEPQAGSDCMVGDQLEIRFEVNHLVFRAKCVVRGIQASGNIGVEILYLSDRSHRQLQELVEELGTLSHSEPKTSEG